MSVLTAAVVLSWGCLAVLTLAMAGILRQLRELQSEVVRLGASPSRAAIGRRVPELAGAEHLVLLVLDPGCGFCDAVHEPFTRLAGRHPGARFEMLSPTARWAGSPNIRFRVDPGLITELDLPWAPALLHVGADGTVLAEQPVTSPERLEEQVAGLLTTPMHQQGAS
ncbi:MAG: hypothetical protein JO063_09930 [Pseudonocardiales bacterium]|nr:hypothetical protein [Pseudonocardiales bacterium]MBV9030281.1 hypothetical protein [Pseudonocardiales bacterium]MBW0010416.1 hypothetical protein [Pseudonocardiales bacterium]